MLWAPCPWQPSGYSTYVRYLAPALAQTHDVSIFAFQGLTGRINWGDITVFGNPIPHSQYFVKETARRWKADLTIQIFDLWTVSGMLHRFLPPGLIVHTPIDSEPLAEWFKDTARQAVAVVPQSNFGKRVFEEGGIICEDTIYNGIDTSIFYPHDKKEARKSFGFPEDAFVVLMVGVNKGDRKNVPNQMEAFHEFRQKASDAMLIDWTYPFFDNMNPEGMPLSDIWERIDGDKTKFMTPTLEDYYWGLEDEEMAKLYSAGDVLLECSLGEGFGRPIIEAMACGCPVIASDNSAMTELVKDRGWLVPCSRISHWQQFLAAKQCFPDTDAITEALMDCYTDTKKRSNYITKGLEFASELDYSKIIRRQWLPLIDKLSTTGVIDFNE